MTFLENGDVNRLQKILKNNYFHIQSETFEILKEDLLRLLSAYFDDLTDFDLKVDYSDEYRISFTAKAASVNDVKSL